ncbi:hypothetical protein DOJK_01456 [Patescibacteria group bacterium]|nr:hypothetical protein DOJK_01456 [Patescibacteria group bacterium]
MYKSLNQLNIISEEEPHATLSEIMYKMLNKFNGANPHNALLISAVLTSLSVVITWGLELLANEILLQH